MFMLLLMMICSMLSFDRRAWLKRNWTSYFYVPNRRQRIKTVYDGTEYAKKRIRYNQLLEHYPFLKNCKGNVVIGGEKVVKPRSFVPCCTFIIFLILGYLFVGLPLALPLANRYFVGNGVGAGKRLNRAANWSASSGGGGGETVPAGPDDVFFDGNSGSCDSDINLSCSSFTTAGYGDTFSTLGFEITVDGNFSHTGGTFIHSGFLEVYGDFTMSATWTDAGGTIDIDDTCAWNATLTTTNLEWDAINGTITVTAGNTITVLENLSIFGNDTNDVTITSAGNFTIDLDASIVTKFANHATIDHMQLGAGDTLIVFNGTDSGNNDGDITFTAFDRLSNASGAFDDDAKWDGGVAPITGVTWEIAVAHTMTIQGTEASASGAVNGTLQLDGQADSAVAKLTLDADSVLAIASGGTFDTTGTGTTGYAEVDTASGIAHIHNDGTFTPGTEFHWSSIHSDVTDIGASEKLVIDDANCVFHAGFDIANTGEIDAGANALTIDTGAINIDGTFTHTGVLTLAGEHTISGTSITFTDVNAGTSPGDTIFVDDATIEGDLTIGSGDFVTLDGTTNTVTLTFSKTGAQPKIEGPGTLRFKGNTSNYTEVEGNGTYNILFDTATTLVVDWDFGGSGSKVQLDRCEIDIAVTTGGDGVTITQTGAVIVDATTTITAADTWDTADLAFTINVSGNVNALVCNGTVTFGASTITIGTSSDWWAVSIGSGGTIDGETATIESGAVNIGNGATFTSTSGVWTISRSYVHTSLFDAWNVDSGSTPSYASGTLTFTYAGAMSITDAHASVHPYNIIANHASLSLNPKTNNLIIANDLTITAGIFTTTDGADRDLTVTNLTSVTGTLTCNASTVSLGSGITGSFSLTVIGTFTGGSGTHTIGSTSISSAGSMTVTSGTTTFDGAGSATYIINQESAGTFTHANGSIIATYAGGTRIRKASGTLTLYDFTINNASNTCTLQSHVTFANDLIITAGELDTSGSNFNLVVTGATSIIGTITENGSTVTYGSCTINASGTISLTSVTTTVSGALILDAAGTLTGNGGTLSIGASSDFQQDYTLACDIDLTGTCAFDVITIANTFTLGGGSAAVEMEALVINSGGTYTATSDVTTVTSETVGGYAYDNDGTLTNSSGTFTFTYAGTTLIDADGTAGNFYNLILNHASLVFTQDTAMTVDNDLTITAGELDTSGTDYSITVTNVSSVIGTLTCNGSTVSLGSGITGSAAISGTGTFTGGSGTHTIGSMDQGVGSSFTLTSGTTTIDGNGSATYIINIDSTGTFAHGSGTIVVTTSGAIRMRKASATLTLNNFQYSGNNTLGMYSIVTFDGDVTLDASTELDTNSGSNYALTVVGATSITGTITGNGSTISFVDLAVNSSGTYNASTATQTITGTFNVHGSGTLTENGGTFSFNGADTTFDWTTDTGGTTITLAGNSEFDALVVSVGDTFDFNSKEATFSDDVTGSGTIQDTGSAGKFIGTATGSLLATNVVVANVDAADGCNIGFTSSTFPTGAVVLNTSGNVVSKHHATVSNVFNLQFTSLSYANMPIQPGSSDNITLISGTWTLGITADNDQYGTLTCDATTVIQVVDFCDIYVTSFTLNGVWNRTGVYGGNIHVGTPPFEAPQILDADIKLDMILDSINIIHT